MYLWRRDQTELLQEMIDCQIDAIIIKVRGAISLKILKLFIANLGRLTWPHSAETFGKVYTRNAKPPGENAREIWTERVR